MIYLKIRQKKYFEFENNKKFIELFLKKKIINKKNLLQFKKT